MASSHYNRGELGIQCMLCSSEIIGEVLPEIFTMEQ